MKLFNLEICLKRSKLLYKKSWPKTIKLYSNIIATKATKMPPLGSLLGTYGINAENFCLQFNLLTLGYNNVLLPTTITVLPSKTFSIKVNLPTFYNQFIMIFKKKTYLLVKNMGQPLQLAQLIALYKIYLINNRNLNFFIQGVKSTRSYDWQALGEKPTVKFYSRKKK